MNSYDTLKLGRLSRKIANLAKAAARIDETRRRMRDAVKNDTGSGGDDWKALRAVAVELMAECDQSLHADLEQVIVELGAVCSGTELPTR